MAEHHAEHQWDNMKGYAWIKDMPSHLLINFVRTYNMIEFILNKHYQEYGLSETKFNALFLLYKASDGLLLSELGDLMLVTRANITGLMDRLEKDELVQRLYHPNDRRSIIAKITEKGREIIEKIIPRHIKINQELVSNLSEEEKKIANTILEKLYQHLLSMANK
ncbi:MarR family transcriptional regulator [Bacillota bacterium LX-D]|nr:MarR family transcriptional regulator [Bacillota bacterium LX-D]